MSAFRQVAGGPSAMNWPSAEAKTPAGDRQGKVGFGEKDGGPGATRPFKLQLGNCKTQAASTFQIDLPSSC